jgi:hypothetical protein
VSDFSVEGAELKKLLNFSRAKPISFAYCPGSKVETDLFGLHKKKPPAVMGKAIRADGDGPKVAFGTLQMEGKVVSLHCEKAMPALAKKVKKFLKLNKLSKNVRILDMDGNVMEEDIEDLPDDPDDDVAADATPQAAPNQTAAAEPETPPADEPAAKEQPSPSDALKLLAARAKALQPQVAAVPNPTGDKVRQAFATAVASLKSGNIEAAGKTLDAIDQILAKLGAASAAKAETPAQAAAEPAEKPKGDPATLKKLQEAAVQLAPKVKALPAGDHSAALANQLREVIGHIRDGAVDPALSGLRAVQQGLKSTTAQSESAEADADPLTIWNAAKEATDGAISALQSKIRQFPDPDLERIAEMGLNGITQGNQTAMMKQLFEFRQVDATARPKAAAALQAQCNEYRTFLADSALITLCEQNPFGVTVDLRKPLGKALDQIERVAAAAAA